MSFDVPEGLGHDDFDIQLRCQGWNDFQCKPVEGDREVIGQRWPVMRTPKSRSSSDDFYYDVGDNTFRKLLRFIFSRQVCTREELKHICDNDQKLDNHLARMQSKRVVVQDGSNWKKSSEYQDINDIGHTLEWYVAEWFRLSLHAAARHGVKVKGIACGGDLDVVAFVDGKRIMVECKSGNPIGIDEPQLNLFLQRSIEFSPDISILLVDTDSRIDRLIDTMNKCSGKYGDPLILQDKHESLYWGMRRIYVTNISKSIDSSLSAVLRLYSSDIKYRSFWG